MWTNCTSVLCGPSKHHIEETRYHNCQIAANVYHTWSKRLHKLPEHLASGSATLHNVGQTLVTFGKRFGEMFEFDKNYEHIEFGAVRK